jgi:hypothetical protein
VARRTSRRDGPLELPCLYDVQLARDRALACARSYRCPPWTAAPVGSCLTRPRSGIRAGHAGRGPTDATGAAGRRRTPVRRSRPGRRVSGRHRACRVSNAQEANRRRASAVRLMTASSRAPAGRCNHTSERGLGQPPRGRGCRQREQGRQTATSLGCSRRRALDRRQLPRRVPTTLRKRPQIAEDSPLAWARGNSGG